MQSEEFEQFISFSLVICGRRQETEAGKSRKAFSNLGYGSPLNPPLPIKVKILKKGH